MTLTKENTMKGVECEMGGYTKRKNWNDRMHSIQYEKIKS